MLIGEAPGKSPDSGARALPDEIFLSLDGRGLKVRVNGVA